jgi:hypothetical protein
MASEFCAKNGVIDQAITNTGGCSEMIPWCPNTFHPVPFLPIPIAPISGGDPFLDFEQQVTQPQFPIYGPGMQQQLQQFYNNHKLLHIS